VKTNRQQFFFGVGKENGTASTALSESARRAQYGIFIAAMVDFDPDTKADPGPRSVPAPLSGRK